MRNYSSFAQEDVNAVDKVCLLGQTVVENIFGGGDDPVGKLIRFNKIPFKVIGVLAEKGENVQLNKSVVNGATGSDSWYIIGNGFVYRLCGNRGVLWLLPGAKSVKARSYRSVKI